jgi:broad specificity phosphatase PhoE
VRHALKTLTQGRGVTVAAFTSGGPIGTILQTALNAPDAAALELNWRVRNGSLTTLLFHQGRVSLDRFNDTGHFEKGLETMR